LLKREPMRTRTSTADLMPVVGFATRGLSIRTLLIRMKGAPLPLHVALDIAMSVARLVRAEHDAGREVGSLDDSRVVLMENGMISLMAGGDRLAPELKNPAAKATFASDVFAVGCVLSRLVGGARSDDDGPVTSMAELPVELEQLLASCLSTDPKMRPSQLKHVEKALAQFLTDDQIDAALEERIALVKENTPAIAKPFAAEEPRVIATEDVQSRLILRGGGRSGLIYGGLVVGLLFAAGAWWWLKPSAALPAPVAAAPAPTPEVVAAPPAVDDAPAPAPAEPELSPPPAADPEPAAKAPPAKAKKHRRR
jgi:hypothetical protein